MALEIVRLQPDDARAFFCANEREAYSTAYGFPVIWHEQRHAFLAQQDAAHAGAAQIRIAASLAHVEKIVVLPEFRRRGIGRALLEQAADVASYYNCHKMTAAALHNGGTQAFLEACGYKIEAVLPQHTFKLDIAVLRKFLL